jgi:hypothetical protein
MGHCKFSFAKRNLGGMLGPMLTKPSYFPIWQSEWWNDFLVRTGWAKKGFSVSAGGLSGFFELRSVGFGQFGLFCV